MGLSLEQRVYCLTPEEIAEDDAAYAALAKLWWAAYDSRINVLKTREAEASGHA